MSNFPPMKNTLILQSASCNKTDVTSSPIWIMRQAGRYLPEFRNLRAKHEFFEICRTPSLACEITLQPIDRFNNLLDASIIFSDILVVPQAVGMIVEMLPKEGPKFPSPIRSPSDLKSLDFNVQNAIQKLRYVFDAISLTRTSLNGRVPLIGFSGAPWTLAAYMIEGGGSKQFAQSKSFLLRHKTESLFLLDSLTDIIIEYIVNQVLAGAQMIQVFDSWAGELDPEMFEIYSKPFLLKISERVKSILGDKSVPLILFAKGAPVAKMFGMGYDVYGVDWQNNPSVVVDEALDYLDRHKDVTICLQGNLDPCYLYAPPDVLKLKTHQMVTAFVNGTLKNPRLGYICNLGHGILPDIDPEQVRIFLEQVKSTSKSLLHK